MKIIDKITPLPTLPETYGKDGRLVPDNREPKPLLTADESALFGRSQTFVSAALQRHGVNLASKEIPFIGAEVADFVISEFELAAKAEREAKAEAVKAEAKAD